MTTTSILGILFLIELAIVASGLAVYLFFQLKNLKFRFKQRKTNGNDDEDSLLSLKNLFDLQIVRTRKKITERLPAESEEESQKQASLLKQRIEFLKLEKEVLDEHVTDNTYWKKLCDGIASVVHIHAPETENEPVDESKYKQRIADYQAQLESLHEEFEEYRKRSNKLLTNLSSMNLGQDQDSALNELMADFKEHDESMRARLQRLQMENEKLHSSLNSAEREIYANEYKKNKAKREGSVELSAQTASEEEIGRLRDIIGRQYNSIDELRAALNEVEGGDMDAQLIDDKIQAVTQSQNEMQTCIEVLEMENQRLTDALAAAQSGPTNVELKTAPPQELFDLRLESKELHEKVDTLSTQISEKDEKIKELEAEYDNLQKEFMQMYAQQGN